jgi:hypothetical protein
MGITDVKIKKLLGMQPGIHARQNCDVPPWRHREIAPVKALNVLLIRVEELIEDRHIPTSYSIAGFPC